MGNRSLLECVDHDHDAALSWLRSAVQTPSVTGNEMPFARLVRTELESCTPDYVGLFEAAPGRPVVWGVMRGRGEGPSIMLASHLDTVDVGEWCDEWAGTTREGPFSGMVTEDALWGRGAADAKGGIATAFGAIHALRRAGIQPAGDLITLFVCDEESGVPNLGRSLGMRAAVERIKGGEIPRADFAIYFEPTQLAIYTGQIGFLFAHIGITGESAYFTHPKPGLDALRAGAALLGELWDFGRELGIRGSHPLLGPRQLLVTHFRAGGLIAVPDRCEIELIYTLHPDDDLRREAERIEELTYTAAEESRTSVIVTFPAGRDHLLGGLGFELGASEASNEVRALRSAVARVIPGRDGEAAAPYWSEASLLNACGIPCVYWGPGDIGVCHTPREHIDVREFSLGVKALATFLAGADH